MPGTAASTAVPRREIGRKPSRSTAVHAATSLAQRLAVQSVNQHRRGRRRRSAPCLRTHRGERPMPRPPLLQWDWRESVHTLNGIEFHVVEAGEPGHPLLILCHGFPEFWWAWGHQITPLANAGYHVLVPDMRG